MNRIAMLRKEKGLSQISLSLKLLLAIYNVLVFSNM